MKKIVSFFGKVIGFLIAIPATIITSLGVMLFTIALTLIEFQLAKSISSELLKAFKIKN